ncbi:MULTISPECIES: NAD(P)-dependent oxidoreductase [unclassified Mesorhizobium]|uniref:NAD(P)-dependent oxidoreductase n=1 Tax=unclassified Mesorhizobium TaxID=325217 RepID=UPI00112A620D|nr:MULTISPECIES: NAD(P)-dependent oxidoreductase [unclassified Mesorhizobium]MCA0028794.1 NAD(P)-dependent oxidoreductase [Mesorhizobium sp. B263B1A]TPJ89998.1 NAD(P)-dependent oxidoreductase [Mesorhizobium sp. B2-5-12]TPK19594.1 NAD(P)-dependent oxidoreductase [Mesorhizobium sp. B2-5-6]
MNTTAASEKIGFIGLGLMGHGIAKNIVDKGYHLTFLGRKNRKPTEDMANRGAHEAATSRDVAAASTIVFICVTGSREVEAIIRGPGGLKEGLRKGSVVVDCSTSDPVSTVALAAELKTLGVDYVDAPLSRTPKEAWEGTLDAMVGAPDAVFARIKPVIETWAGRIVHIGDTGDGHRMKLLNNFVSLGYAAIYSEALALAEKVGISPQRFDSVIRNGRMDCGFYETFMRWTLEGDRDAHKFTIANAFKDLTYLESMAGSAGIANPLGNATKNAFAGAHATGPAEQYVPMLATYIGKVNGVDLMPMKNGKKQTI